MLGSVHLVTWHNVPRRAAKREDTYSVSLDRLHTLSILIYTNPTTRLHWPLDATARKLSVTVHISGWAFSSLTLLIIYERWFSVFCAVKTSPISKVKPVSQQGSERSSSQGSYGQQLTNVEIIHQNQIGAPVPSADAQVCLLSNTSRACRGVSLRVRDGIRYQNAQDVDVEEMVYDHHQPCAARPGRPVEGAGGEVGHVIGSFEKVVELREDVGDDPRVGVVVYWY
jgi:hypothetical protein